MVVVAALVADAAGEEPGGATGASAVAGGSHRAGAGAPASAAIRRSIATRGAPASVPIRLSVAPGGEPADGASSHAAISADGRLVAFRSEAENLVPGAPLGLAMVLTRSLAPDGEDGGLALGPARAIGSVWDDERAELSSAADTAVSADGRVVAFRSSAAGRHGAGGPLGLFVHELASAETLAVDIGMAGEPPNGASGSPSLSEDGRLVAFHSWADNLVPGDDNAAADVFVRDLARAETRLISRRSTGGGPADGSSLRPWLTPDGRLVVYESDASDLVSGDGNGARDVFALDLERDVTERVSLGSGGWEAGRDSHSAVASADGRFVAFASAAGELSPSALDGAPAVFLRDRLRGTTALVSAPVDGGQWGELGDDVADMPAISADGRLVAFRSTSRRLDRGPARLPVGIVIVDRIAAATARIDAGETLDGPSGVVLTRGGLGGGLVVFSSGSALDAEDRNTVADVFAAVTTSAGPASRIALPWLSRYDAGQARD